MPTRFVRVQILLSPQDLEELKKLSETQFVSLSALVRQAIKLLLRKEKRNAK